MICQGRHAAEKMVAVNGVHGFVKRRKTQEPARLDRLERDIPPRFRQFFFLNPACTIHSPGADELDDLPNLIAIEPDAVIPADAQNDP